MELIADQTIAENKISECEYIAVELYKLKHRKKKDIQK